MLYFIFIISLLLYRFYLRYVTYYLKLFLSADGSVFEEAKEDIKNELIKTDNYSGHNLRLGLWAYFRKGGPSLGSYYIATTINPIIFALIITFIFW